MSEKFQLQTVEGIIGYTFKDPSLITTAFHHPSAASNSQPSNEALSFLGKAILDLLIRDYLYTNFEGNATQLKIVAEIEPMLKKSCSDLKLNEYLVLSDSAEALRYSKIVGEELFHALAGAIYKDGGMPSVRAFLLPRLRAVMLEEAPELVRDSQRRNARKTKSERDPFSDDISVSEKRSSSTKSAASALKSLFSPKKRKTSITEQDDTPFIPAEEASTDATKDEKAPLPNTARRDSAPKEPLITQLQSLRISDDGVSDGNYKSVLQEYVQKNIRSSTVMLEYKDRKSADGVTVEIYLFGKKISEANGSTKKEASQNTACLAYRALTDVKSEAYQWFSELKSDPERINEQNTEKEDNDYVSQLNRTYQKLYHRSDAPIKYEPLPSPGKHLFATAVNLDGKRMGEGEGKTAKEAKQNAAKAALVILTTEKH
ncbi:MAG: hypothetical protein IKB34_09455 [Clostridia bacterium]|nr:hypothetical protein [Clostridia bacterium]